MNPWQEAVKDFHQRSSLVTPSRPVRLNDKEEDLALKLIREETGEIHTACALGDVPLIASEIVDLLYVTIGMAVRMGVNLDPLFIAIHQANLAKLENGGPFYRKDGKLIKPPGWKPADIRGVMLRQMESHEQT